MENLTLTPEQQERIESLISIWSMRPQPETPLGIEWEEGCVCGYREAIHGYMRVRDLSKPNWNQGYDQGYEWGLRKSELEEPPKAPDPLLEAVLAYRTARSKIVSLKSERYKVGDPVRVDCSRFHGWGRVAFFNGDSLEYDELPVVLENGNTWHYPVDACQPAGEDDHPMIKRCPNYAKR